MLNHSLYIWTLIKVTHFYEMKERDVCQSTGFVWETQRLNRKTTAKGGRSNYFGAISQLRSSGDILILSKTPIAVKETMIHCIEAPRLKGVSRRQFIDSKRRLELYEKQSEEKQRWPKEKTEPASYSASIEHEVSEYFLAARSIWTTAIQDTTKLQLKHWTKMQIHLQGEWRTVISSGQCDKELCNARGHNWCRGQSMDSPEKCCEALRAAGYGNLTPAKPQIFIRHILKHWSLSNCKEDAGQNTVAKMKTSRRRLQLVNLEGSCTSRKATRTTDRNGRRR